MTTYYISGAGSDSNLGNLGSPWLTFAHADSIVQPGDTVIVATGYTYTLSSTFVSTSSGTANAPITWTTNVTKPWLNPSSANAVIAGGNAALEFIQINIKGNYVYWSGFEFNEPTASVCFDLWGQHCKVTNCYIHDVASSGSIAANTPGAGIFDSGANGAGYNEFAYNRIVRMSAINSTNVGNSVVHCIYTSGSHDFIHHNVCISAPGYGIYSHGTTNTNDHDIVANNLCAEMGNSGIAFGCSGGSAVDFLYAVNNVLINNGKLGGAGYGIRETDGNSQTGTNSVYDHNLTFGNSSGAYSLQNSLVATGQITTQPSFLNYVSDGSGDYHEQVGSVTVNAGIGYLPTWNTTWGWTSDLDGNPVPLGPIHDLGPYQAQFSGVTAPGAANTPLTLYAYNLSTGSSNVYEVEQLQFTTVAPGGFGSLSAVFLTPDARTVPPELRLFANVALVGGGFTAFQGRWDEPAIVLDATSGSEFQLRAQGAGTVMADDPGDYTYTAKTALQIISDQLSQRSAYIQLDADTSAILPTNPSPTYTLGWNGEDLNAVMTKLLPLVGDYQWTVWDHPHNRDAAGFPTWQLLVHARDTSTVSYTALEIDENNYSITPTGEYSYNAIQIKYKDFTTGVAASVTVKDSRLGAGNIQGTAPFPYRKLVKDLSGYPLTSTQATVLANALLAQYQNGGFKIQVVINRVRDAYGNEIPLWMVRADANIFLPEVSPIGSQLPTSQIAGTNVFYITETQYDESQGSDQAPILTLVCDSFYDTAGFQIARLQYDHDVQSANGSSRSHRRTLGHPQWGFASVGWPSIGTAGAQWSYGVNYGATMTQVPTSISLTTLNSLNLTSVQANNITETGFELQANENANGAGNVRVRWQVVGN